jgi:acetoin utilization deacetylase AcuC-like enzyme/ribosomal protein S18 acetylase RimI-like enzyme
MLKIRRIRDARVPSNRITIQEVQEIIRARFPGMRPAEIDKLPAQLEDPLKHQFVSELLVAETAEGVVRGFALLLFAPDLRFAYLETLSTAPGRSGSGVGAALYQDVREAARVHGARGLYFECLPDDPALSPNGRVRRQNEARLKFYERFGARPVLGTLFETPVDPRDSDAPYLVFDGLDRHDLPPARGLAAIVEAILRRKYADVCPEDYIRKVVASVRGGKPALRPWHYVEPEPAARTAARALPQRIPLVVNDLHDIHHVRERGYVEAPVRVAAILRELSKTDLFEIAPARHFPERWIREVHSGGLIEYLQQACAEAPLGKSIYPYVFPVRNAARRPRERSVLAGYWCIDTFTPIHRNAYPAARHAVDCALTAADAVLRGAPLAYALVRPPGHHAEHRSFGGFCYFGNSAIAANYLSKHGRVAMLDIDYHHGNGQQDIFYERRDVLTVSVHGDPSFAYPYFTGFRNERGRGAGAGFNLNLPLPEATTPEMHREAVRRALRRIARFAPDFLVLAVGYDTARGDPTGTWSNVARDFEQLGRMIGAAGYPCVAVQEGGYRMRTLGSNARSFFAGLAEGIAAAGQAHPRPAPRQAAASEAAALNWRESVSREDALRVRRLVAGTGMFTAAEVEIAVELVDERVAKGRASGYEFVLAEQEGRLLGYACYGATPATKGTVDLYWIVVDAACQGRGLGREILTRTEAAARALGGRRLYVDTSGSEKYASTRGFYRRSGFRKVAELPDFYAEGDGKVILAKDIAA